MRYRGSCGNDAGALAPLDEWWKVANVLRYELHLWDNVQMLRSLAQLACWLA